MNQIRATAETFKPEIASEAHKTVIVFMPLTIAKPCYRFVTGMFFICPYPQYSNEEILFAALACGLDWLRRDEKLAMKLRQWYPPETSKEQFTHVAVKLLSGRICGYIPRQAPRLYRGIDFGDGLGPW